MCRETPWPPPRGIRVKMMQNFVCIHKSAPSQSKGKITLWNWFNIEISKTLIFRMLVLDLDFISLLKTIPCTIFYSTLNSYLRDFSWWALMCHFKEKNWVCVRLFISLRNVTIFASFPHWAKQTTISTNMYCKWF